MPKSWVEILKYIINKYKISFNIENVKPFANELRLL